MTQAFGRLLPAVAATALTIAGVSVAKAELPAHWEESGQASWYGPGFHGRRTSSGTVYNQNAMTAAHAFLPLGTRLRVTMQETGRSVVVIVTDRQPARGARVIDLSRAAAGRVGILGSGTGWVTLSPAKGGDPIEVAEAPDDESDGLATPRRHGPRHKRHVSRKASAGR